MNKKIQKKILITGCDGQLGRDLITLLADRFKLIGIDKNELDITDYRAVKEYLKEIKPDIILHAAAFTNVDLCESQKEIAYSVNVDGTKNLARFSSEINARIIYYSTDYVFSGDAREKPYNETNQPAPKTVYGQTKLDGEKAIKEITDNFAIMRLAWVYGYHGHNFVKTMLKLGLAQIAARENSQKANPLKVVNDQIGSPTWTEEIARQTITVIENDLTGTYHVTAEDFCSWYEFARDIFELFELKVDIEPCSTSEYPRPAPRPAYSVLANAHLDKLGLNQMKPYHEALSEFVKKHRSKLLESLNLS